jgi:hypothetical protein
MDFILSGEYIFIDHFRMPQSGGLGPFGSSFTGVSDYFNKTLLDANGWFMGALSGSDSIGFGFLIPHTSSFSGPYIIWGTGEGTFNLGGGLTYTVASPGTGGAAGKVTSGTTSNVTVVSNGTYTVTDTAGTGWTILINSVSGASASGPQNVPFQITANLPTANGKYLGYNGALNFFRSADASDFQAGKIFRSAYKNNIVALNPSAIRFMNWVGGNLNNFDDHTTRWEFRQTPNIIGTMNNTISPPYLGATATGNKFSLASATGMPGSMQQGEVVSFRADASAVRMPPAFTGPSAVTVANPGRATWTAHGFITGDVLIWRVSSGMTGLDYVRGTITVIDANTFDIGIDTTGQPAWVNGSGSVTQYITMNVGGRGDFPTMCPDGQQASGTFGAGSNFQTGNYYTLYFDKNNAASSTTIGGAPTYGTWHFAISPAPHKCGVPIELCTALINEINALYTTQGPTHMYMCCPMMGLLSLDQDYSSGSNWAINAVTTILNGANGYAGLTSKANLFLEYSNETWNTSGEGSTANYLTRVGQLRNGVNNQSTYTSVRSGVMVQDVKGVFPGNSRIKFVIGLQGAQGMGIAGTPNYDRINGSPSINGDTSNSWAQVASFTGAISSAGVLTTSGVTGTIKVGQLVASVALPDSIKYQFVTSQLTGPAGGAGTYQLTSAQSAVGSQAMTSAFAPMSLYDFANMAPYIDVGTNWNSTVVVPSGGTGLSALADDYVNNPSHQTANINAYMVGLTTDNGSGANGTSFYTTIMQTYASVMGHHGRTKNIMCYEGGWNPAIAGSGLTANEITFLYAVHNSQQWSDAWIAFVNQFNIANAAFPGEFTRAGSRWGHALPPNGSNFLDTYSGTNEFGALDVTWTNLGTRNNALSL